MNTRPVSLLSFLLDPSPGPLGIVQNYFALDTKVCQASDQAVREELHLFDDGLIHPVVEIVAGLDKEGNHTLGRGYTVFVHNHLCDCLIPNSGNCSQEGFGESKNDGRM